MKRLYNKDLHQTSVKEKMVLKPQFLPADLLLVVLATILFVIIVVNPVLNDNAVLIALGFILVLFLPGYSLIAALFPKKGDLNSIERTALSFGISIAITPLIGLLLNYTPFGIMLTSLILAASLFTILMVSTAYIRRWKMPPADRFTIKFKRYFNNIVRVFKQESGIAKFLSIVIVICIVLAVSMTAYAIAIPKGEKFTEFYILGSGDKTSDYPTNLTVGENGTILIGIVNHENAKTDYNMVIQLNGKTIRNENITLSNNNIWKTKFTFSASQKGKNQKLDFLLYKLPDKRNAYRSLHIWINAN